MRIYRKQREEGVALLTATLFIAIAVLVLAALSLRVVNQSRQVDQYVNYTDCFQGLEAAFAHSKADLEAFGDGMIGCEYWYPPMRTM